MVLDTDRYVHLDGKIEALGRVVPGRSSTAESKGKFMPFRVSFRGGKNRDQDLVRLVNEGDKDDDGSYGVASEVVSLGVIDVRDNFETQTEEAMAEVRCVCVCVAVLRVQCRLFTTPECCPLCEVYPSLQGGKVC